MGIFKKIQHAVKNRTTYRVGLLQAKVYRTLKTFTGEKLAPYKITTIDWAMLGLLYDTSGGMRGKEIAEELGVEAPFVTVLFAKLKKMNLIDSKIDTTDSRAKNIFLTKKGKEFVPQIESVLYNEMKIFLEGVPKSDIVTYISVLQSMEENSGHISIKNSRQSYYEGV